uniref:MAPEG family protein n=1 Tax=Alexandrium andersonii TaxID=327968 RepID=A0A7S2GTH8_9DINO|mmetsp:Transcript_63504/g.142860  ORF Transcript_63504/g.142860 Transcript_63504/m.142860 type:complete len:182 (+) Transcript_63504:138-683(+)
MVGYEAVDKDVELVIGSGPGVIKTTVELLIFTVIAYFTTSGPLKDFPAEGKEYKLLVLSFVSFFFVAYCFVMRQGTTYAALNKPEVIKSQDPKIVSGLKNVDRTTLNMLEQMPCFLLMALPYALFVSPTVGAYLVFAYVFFLILYPVLYDKGAPLLFISTFPRYFILYYMAGALLVTALRT